MLGTLFAVLSAHMLIPWNAGMPMWILAYPIVDVSLVVSIRWWNGLPLSLADRSHLHHWMMDHLGSRAWLATPALWILALLPMFRSTALPGSHIVSLVGVMALVGLGVKAFFDRTRPSFPAPPIQVPHKVPGPPRRERTGPHRMA